MLSTLETVLGPKEAIPGAGLPDSSIQGFVNTAEFSAETDGEACMSLEDFHKWCLLVPSLKKFLSGLLASPSAGKYLTSLFASVQLFWVACFLGMHVI